MSYRILRIEPDAREYDVEVDGEIYYFAELEDEGLQTGGPWVPMFDIVLRDLTHGQYDWLWSVEVMILTLQGQDIREYNPNMEGF